MGLLTLRPSPTPPDLIVHICVVHLVPWVQTQGQHSVLQGWRHFKVVNEGGNLVEKEQEAEVLKDLGG